MTDGPDTPKMDPVDNPMNTSEPLRRAIGDRYLTYALSTIMHRALPDARDGLKPVHRRILYVMSRLRLSPTGGFLITTGLAEKGESWVDPVGNWQGYIASQPAWELYGNPVPRFGMPLAQSREQLAFPLAWYQHGEGHVPWPAFDEFYDHAEMFGPQ